MWDNMEMIWKQNTGEQFDQTFMVCCYTSQQAFLYSYLKWQLKYILNSFSQKFVQRRDQ
jgi:hypothetical protein